MISSRGIFGERYSFKSDSKDDKSNRLRALTDFNECADKNNIKTAIEKLETSLNSRQAHDYGYPHRNDEHKIEIIENLISLLNNPINYTDKEQKINALKKLQEKIIHPVTPKKLFKMIECFTKKLEVSKSQLVAKWFFSHTKTFNHYLANVYHDDSSINEEEFQKLEKWLGHDNSSAETNNLLHNIRQLSSYKEKLNAIDYELHPDDEKLKTVPQNNFLTNNKYHFIMSPLLFLYKNFVCHLHKEINKSITRSNIVFDMSDYPWSSKANTPLDKGYDTQDRRKYHKPEALKKFYVNMNQVIDANGADCIDISDFMFMELSNNNSFKTNMNNITIARIHVTIFSNGNMFQEQSHALVIVSTSPLLIEKIKTIKDIANETVYIIDPMYEFKDRGGRYIRGDNLLKNKDFGAIIVSNSNTSKTAYHSSGYTGSEEITIGAVLDSQQMSV